METKTLKQYFELKKIIVSAMLIALTIVLENFVSFKVFTYQIGFYFIPIAVTAILFGPIYAALVYGITDILGYLINPQGAYIPLLTVSCVIIGIIYGLIYYRKTIPVTFTQAGLRVLLCASIVAALITLGLNCWILAHAYGSFYIAMVPGRFLQTIIMLPMQVIILSLVWIKLVPLLSGWSVIKPVKMAAPVLSERMADKKGKYAVIAFVLSIITLLCSPLPFASIAGVVIGVITVKMCDRLTVGGSKGIGITGLILGWTGLLVSTLSSILYILFFFAAEKLLNKFSFLAVFYNLFDKITAVFK